MGLLIEDKKLSALVASSHSIPCWHSFVFAASWRLPSPLANFVGLKNILRLGCIVTHDSSLTQLVRLHGQLEVTFSLGKFVGFKNTICLHCIVTLDSSFLQFCHRGQLEVSFTLGKLGWCPCTSYPNLSLNEVLEDSFCKSCSWNTLRDNLVCTHSLKVRTIYHSGRRYRFFSHRHICWCNQV